MKFIALSLIAIVILSGCAPVAEPPAQTQLHKVDSSFIDQIGYDAAAQTLTVQMQNSTDIYTYEGVSQDVFDAFLAAESKGRFFAENIRGQYGSDD